MTLTAEANALLTAVEQAYPEGERLLADLLRFPTVNCRDTPEAIAACQAEVKRCFAFLRDWAAENGFSFRNYDDLVCVIEREADAPDAESGEPETVGAALHVDVVPVAADGWTHPPFSGAVADGFIWGRGAQDDKGPTAQWLMAAKIAKAQGVPFRRKLKLIVGSTEETAEWECMKRFLDEEPEPDFTVVPDAEFPIISGEKGFLTLLAKADFPAGRDARRADGLRFVELSAGDTENIIPAAATLLCDGPPQLEAGLRAAAEAASASVETAPAPGANGQALTRYKIVVPGKAAHSSLPERGVNAAVAGLKLLADLFAGAEHPALKAAAWLRGAAGPSDGAGLGIAHRHEFVGATTASLTILRLSPEAMRATVNIRFAMGWTIQRVLDQARAAAAEALGDAAPAIEPKIGAREALFVDASQFGSYLRALQNSYSDIQGRPAEPFAIGGTTFAKAFTRAVCFGPVDKADGEAELAHQTNERVRVEHHLRNMKIYTLALARLVSGNDSL